MLQDRNKKQIIILCCISLSILLCIQALPVKASPEPSITLLTDFDQAIFKGSALIEWIAEDEHNESLKIYLFQKNQDHFMWKRINDQPLNNTGSYIWNCSSLQDGHYYLKIEAINKYNNIDHDNSKLFTIDNDNSPLTIHQCQFYNVKTGSNEYVKDEDTIQLSIEINNGEYLTKNDITADLQCFQKGMYTTPDYFNGNTAQWNLTNVICNEKNKNISITFDVDNLEQKNITIIADNTKPTIEMKHPINGLYFLNKRFIPIQKTVIIGNIPLDFKASDNTEINKVLMYLDGIVFHEFFQPPYFKLIKEPLFGIHFLKIECIDKADNIQTKTIEVFMFNLF